MGQTAVPRSEIPAEYQWKTSDLYANDDCWETARKELIEQFAALRSLPGTLADRDETSLRSAFDMVFAARQQLARLGSYACRKNDEDTRVPRYQAMKAVFEKLSTDLETALAFLEPELLALPETRLKQLAKAAELSDYSRFIERLLKRKPHVLSPKEEALLAQTGLLQYAPYNAYAAFSGADLRFPPITDEAGKSVELTQAMFARYRASADRAVRKRAFETFFGTHANFQNTFASLLSSQINAHSVLARARHYDSAIDAALAVDELPTSVFQQMLASTNAHLPLLHRYLKLRRKLLGLDTLHYHDLYPPMIAQQPLQFSYQQAIDLLCDSAAPLGAEYVSDLRIGLDPQNGWVDPLPCQGKRSGAYMDGSAYDVHPFVLANYLDDYNSLSTMAHEMGHAMHSYYSNRSQPYAKADYSIFVAEVASTLNEALLARHLLGKLKGADRLYVLGERLEGFRQTFFRQAMFAEFEAACYRLVESGKALTAEQLNTTFLEIARHYYGHQQEVVTIDDCYAVEWAYVPHFYYNFYVFQYVTGITAATALSETILKQGESAAQRYINQMLHRGCAAPPIDLLRDAGVDLTSDEPYRITMRVFERTLEEVERLVA
ncbi:MAG: oligoendopeptidase F [Deltaproteobacteria bacterium]|nr:oligoendopeptidase F [Deltaproteobacteria bacterium]